MLLDHQREAVARIHTLLRTCGGCLLADDVGLGKSFIAATVAKETGAEIDLVVPAALVMQWRETLAEIGVEARVLTHDSLNATPFVPQPTSRLVIVDEAHAFRNPRTQRYDALARRSIGAKLLLVTATPVCNSIADLEALFRLIARDDLLANRGVPSIDLAFATRDFGQLERIVATLVIRRERDVLPPAFHFGTLERQVLRHPLFTADGEIPRLIDALCFPLVGDHALLRRILWRRLESSESALLESLRRQRRFYERALECLAAGRELPKREYRRAFGTEEDRDAVQQVLFWDLFTPREATIEPAVLTAEIARLDALRDCVLRSPREKRRQLVELLAGIREPVLIFTSSVATAHDLAATLRCGVVTSRERSRDAVLRAFREGKLDVVVSTDMAAEGLNLQRAGVVIHYDIPWNPVKLDQRNGRAHRIGQQRDRVRAIYFLPDRDETRIIRTMARKDRIRRRALRIGGEGEAIVTTLRPRLARDAPALKLLHAAEVAGFPLPESIARRHKAGIELLLAEMSREYLDQRRVDDLLALLEWS